MEPREELIEEIDETLKGMGWKFWEETRNGVEWNQNNDLLVFAWSRNSLKKTYSLKFNG